MEKLHLINQKIHWKRTYLTENRKLKNYKGGSKCSKCDNDDMNASTDSMLLNEFGLSTLLQNSNKDTDVSALSRAISCVSNTTFKSIPSDSFNDSLTSNLSNSVIENQTPPCPPILLSSSTTVKEVKQSKKYWEKSTSVNFTGNYQNKY